MKKVFVCSPYRGDIEGNTKLAKKVGRLAACCDYVPIIPHLMYTGFLDDANPEDRIRGLTMSVELLACCDMLYSQAQFAVDRLLSPEEIPYINALADQVKALATGVAYDTEAGAGEEINPFTGEIMNAQPL